LPVVPGVQDFFFLFQFTVRVAALGRDGWPAEAEDKVFSGAA